MEISVVEDVKKYNHQSVLVVDKHILVFGGLTVHDDAESCCVKVSHGLDVVRPVPTTKISAPNEQANAYLNDPEMLARPQMSSSNERVINNLLSFCPNAT